MAIFLNYAVSPYHNPSEVGFMVFFAKNDGRQNLSVNLKHKLCIQLGTIFKKNIEKKTIISTIRLFKAFRLRILIVRKGFKEGIYFTFLNKNAFPEKITPSINLKITAV